MSNSNNPDHDAFERMFPSFHTRLAEEQREAEEGIVDLRHLSHAQAHEYLARIQPAQPERYRLPDGQVIGYIPGRGFIRDPRNRSA
jgi:hypothetical protein